MLTVSIGDQFATLKAGLGTPDVDKPLKNPQPESMGARVVEYDFAADVVTLVRETERRAVRSVQFVLAPDGSVLRILENPNAYHGAAPRLQLGSAFLAGTAEIPTDPALRAVPR